MITKFSSSIVIALFFSQVVETSAAEKFFNVGTDRTNGFGFHITVNPGRILKGGASNSRAGMRRERIPFPDDDPAKRVAMYIPPLVPFSIDPRWKEWSSNAVYLVDAAEKARTAGDFMESSRLELKRKYGEIFAKYYEERSPESRAAQDVEQIAAQRATLQKQREVHVKFQNSEAVAKLDQQIRNNDFEMRRAQARLVALSASELFELLDRELDPRTAAAPIFRVAFAHFCAVPTPDEDVIRRFTNVRECLANAYSYATSPPAVMKKMVELNAALKTIQDDLIAGRIPQAQRAALVMWKAMLD